jgi:Mg2+ and Co2+ transporter CorA
MPNDDVATEATAAIDLMRQQLKGVSDEVLPRSLAKRSLEELMRVRYELVAIRKALQKLAG